MNALLRQTILLCSASLATPLLLCMEATAKTPHSKPAKPATSAKLSKSVAFAAVQHFWQAQVSGDARAAYDLFSGATTDKIPFDGFAHSEELTLSSPDEPKGAQFQKPISAAAVFLLDVANNYHFRFRPYALDPSNPNIVLVSYVTPYVSAPQAFRIVTVPEAGGPKLDLLKSLTATDAAATVKARQRAIAEHR